MGERRRGGEGTPRRCPSSLSSSPSFSSSMFFVESGEREREREREREEEERRNRTIADSCLASSSLPSFLTSLCPAVSAVSERLRPHLSTNLVENFAFLLSARRDLRRGERRSEEEDSAEKGRRSRRRSPFGTWEQRNESGDGVSERNREAGGRTHQQTTHEISPDARRCVGS